MISTILNIIFGVLIVILSIVLGYMYRRKENLESRLFRDKAGLYSAFMEKWVEIMLKKPSPERISEELTEFMGKFKLMLILYASDSTYRNFVRAMNKGAQGEKLTIDDVGALFLSMRKDLIPHTDLNEYEVLSSFITDIDKHISKEKIPGWAKGSWMEEVIKKWKEENPGLLERNNNNLTD